MLIIATADGGCRSQMLAGWIRRFGGERIFVRVGSMAPGEPDPRAVQAMYEIGIDTAEQRADPLVKWLDEPWDWAILMRNPEQHRKPNLTATKRVLYHEFPDPAKATGHQEAIMGAYRGVRDDIHDWARAFVEQTIGLTPNDRQARAAESRLNDPT